MSSLAGRPPYATDEPDSYYQSSDNTRRRAPPPAPRSQQARSSVYDVYDNYLDAGKDNNGTQNRNSGVGAAFMNGEMEDDDSDSEEDVRANSRKPMDPHHTPVSIPVPQHVPAHTGKNAALAAAAAAAGVHRGDATPPPQYQQRQMQQQAPYEKQQPQQHMQRPAVPPQAAIAAPRPGYAAPISTLNNNASRAPPGIQVPHPQSPIGGPQASPSPTSPHPLQAPITPIQPAFARPRPPKGDVKFEGSYMRGGGEETLVPKRGEKGDDFWRRFSMVVKDEGSKREKVSPWLRKTTGGISSFSRWVWIIGIILVIAAAGGIGIGWYLSHKSPDHQQPTAIGGSANESGEVSSAKAVGSAGATAKSSFHVSPTNTVARREAPGATGVVHIEPEISWMQAAPRDVHERMPVPTEVVHIEPEISWMNTKREVERRAPAPEVVHIEPEISWMNARRDESNVRQRRQHSRTARHH